MALLTPESVFRRYQTAGVPDSGPHNPDKDEIIQLLNTLFGVSRGGWVVARTLAELNGITPPNANDGGVVLTGTGAGYYDRDGGAWVFGRPFPDTFAHVVLSGSGTAQTGVVNTGVNPAGIEVFYARVGTANTGPLMLAIEGEAPREVLNLAGNPLTAGEWTGTVLFELSADGKYQLVIDAGAAASAAMSASLAGQEADRAEQALADAVAMIVPDNSVSTPKLVDGAVTADKLPSDPSAIAAILTKLGLNKFDLASAMARWKSDRFGVRRFYAGNTLTSGASSISGGATASGRTFVSGAVATGCRQDGLIRTAKLFVNAVGTSPADNIRLLALRPNGATYDVVGMSEFLTATSTGLNTFNLAVPLPVQPGDQVGWWLKGGAAGVCTTLQAATSSDIVRSYSGGLAAGGETWVDNPNLSIPGEFSGIPPFVLVVGESIQEGHNDAAHWHSHYHLGPTGNPLAEPMNQVRALIPGIEYQNWAEGSTLWTRHVQKSVSVEGFAAPRAVIVGGGVNDVYAGRPWQSVLAEMNAFKATLPPNTVLFVLEMLPYPSGTDAMAATIRLWNSYYATWCEETGSTLIRCHDDMGQIRPSTGQLDDLKPAYRYGSTDHLSYAGVDRYASHWANALKAQVWL